MKRSDQLPDSEIYFYDKKSGSTHTITNNDYDDRFPYVSDLDYIVWMGHDGHDWEIYLYDYALGSTTQLTDNLSDDEFPHICSNFVVWQGKVDNQYEIFRATIRK
jgi:Tol biopolymer transport system component